MRGDVSNIFLEMQTKSRPGLLAGREWEHDACKCPRQQYGGME